MVLIKLLEASLLLLVLSHELVLIFAADKVTRVMLFVDTLSHLEYRPFACLRRELLGEFVGKCRRFFLDLRSRDALSN